MSTPQQPRDPPVNHHIPRDSPDPHEHVIGGAYTEIQTISGIWFLVTSWLFGICLIYYLYRFYALKDDMIFIKRRGRLVVSYSLCSIFVLVFGYPSAFFIHWGFEFAPADHHSTTFVILEIVGLINIFVYYLDGMLILLRYWMIYYDIHFSNGCLNLKWKQCISKSINALKKDRWYIHHRATLGNQSFMIRRVIMIAVIVSVVSIVMHASYTLFDAVPRDTSPYLSSILFLIMLVILIIIWNKTPSFEDKISLHKEFRIIAIFWICTVCVYGFTEVITHYVLDNKPNVILHCFQYFCAIFMPFIVSFVSTFGVLRYTQSAKKASFDTDMEESQGLMDIFNNADALKIFTQHLIKEFSIECLLSVIEFQQFKLEAMKAFDIELNEECITFSNSVPHSDIVYDSNDIDDSNDIRWIFKKKAHKLYKKYIENESDFQINVSSATRHKLMRCMKDYEAWMNESDNCMTGLDLAKIFDRATYEMYQLLTYSQRRLQRVRK